MFSRRSTFEAADALFAEETTGSIDLTVSNPSAVGLAPEMDATLAPLQNPAAMAYQPDPRGLLSAREAIAAYYSGVVTPEQIVLTASTSEAYSFLFRLLCDPGDAVLVPQPSYPLFDMLAAYDMVELLRYPLRYDGAWSTDLHAFEGAITPRTRAAMLVHPNNPTGHCTSLAEQAQMDAIAARRGLAVIADEVFLDYSVEGSIDGDAPQSFARRASQALTFTLSGLSKVCALPQMKLAWICVTGPEALRDEALYRLDLLADSFLSVGTPAQLALPSWMAQRGAVQQRILDRVRANLCVLRFETEGSEVTVLRVEAGWCAVLRVPAICDDQAMAEELARSAGVRVHPGSFYGFPARGYLVISLLPQEAIFNAGVAALIKGIKHINYQ